MGLPSLKSIHKNLWLTVLLANTATAKVLCLISDAYLSYVTGIEKTAEFDTCVELGVSGMISGCQKLSVSLTL